MKKIVSGLLIFVFIINMVGCSNAYSGEVDKVTQAGITTSGSKDENSDSCIWQKKYYVDEFNEPTSSWYLSAISTGTFNNSAVSKRELTVEFLLDRTSFSIKLYEYGKQLVKNSSSKDHRYSITVKCSNGNKETVFGYIPSGGDRMYVVAKYLYGKDRQNVLRLFQNSNLSFYIEDDNRATTNYLFTVSTAGLAEKYYGLMGEAMPSGLQYALTETEDGYAVTDFGMLTDSTIVIPEEYNGKPVVAIEKEAFRDCDWLVSVEIPDSVQIIEEYAFCGCSSLKTVSGMKNVSTIGKKAFSECTALTGFTIPNNCCSISEGTFNSCYKLQKIIIPDSVTSIEESAFAYCYDLELVILGDNVAYIGRSAFSACDKLKLTAFDNAQYLPSPDNQYFALIQAKDKSIESCQINNETKVIAGGAFAGCSKIDSIIIPESVESIGEYAFVDSASEILFEKLSDWQLESWSQEVILSSDEIAFWHSVDWLLYKYRAFKWSKIQKSDTSE